MSSMSANADGRASKIIDKGNLEAVILLYRTPELRVRLQSTAIAGACLGGIYVVYIDSFFLHTSRRRRRRRGESCPVGEFVGEYIS